MPVICLTSGGRVVGVCTITAWNRYRSATRKAKWRRDAAARAADRKVLLDGNARMRRQKEMQRLHLCRHRHFERKRRHAAMLRRRQAKWGRPRRSHELGPGPRARVG